MSYQPIRWDNIGGSSLSEASRPLDAAARAFDMGFGSIRNVLDQRSAIQDQNFAAGVRNNTNTVMNQLMGVDGVDAFKAAKQGLGATLDGYGAQIDQQAIRNFADQRVGVLQDRDLKTMAYENTLKDERSHPFMDAYKVAAQKGDTVGMAAAEASYRQAGGRDLASLVKYADDTGWTKEQRGEDRKSWVRAEGKYQDDLKTSAVGRTTALGNLAVNQGQLGVAQRNARVNEANALAMLDERLQNQDTKLRAEYAQTFKNEAGSLAGQAVIDDAISSIKDPDDQKQARIAASEILKKNPKASTNAVVASIKGIDANWALDILERSAAARNAAKMDANGTGSNDAAYAEELRKTLAAKIATNQTRRDSLSTGGLGLGDRGTGNIQAPVTTVPNPVTNDQPASAPAPVTNAPTPVQAAPTPSVMQPRPMTFQEQILAGQAALQQRNVMIADRERMQNLQEQQAKAQAQLAYAEKRLQALNDVPDKNPNKGPLLERAKAERDRLKALLGN